jgi:hypothetical protein
MKDMNVDANALTFGQYARSLTQGTALSRSEETVDAKKKSAKLREICSTESFRTLMNKSKDASTRKKIVSMFAAKKDKEQDSRTTSPRPKSWAHKRMDLSIEVVESPSRSFRARTPTVGQLATAAATASSPDVEQLEKRRNAMSASRAIDLKRAMRTRRSSSAQRRLSLSPAVVAAASKELLRRRSSSNDEKEKEQQEVPRLSISVSQQPVLSSSSSSSKTLSPPDNMNQVHVLMWCRTPVGGDDVNGFSLLDEELLASWSLRPDLRRHNDKLNPPYGEPFVPRLKYSIRRDGVKKEERGDVKYVSPVQLRLYLEETIELHGYGALQDLFKTSPFLYWNMLWYCTRVGIPMPLNGPIPSSARVVIRWDEKPLNQRLCEDLGCKDEKELAELKESFELESLTWQTNLRFLLKKRSRNSNICSSIYQQCLWLSSTRDYKDRASDTSSSITLETMRSLQAKWLEFDAAYIFARRQLPKEYENLLNRKIDMRGTCSLCIPIRAFFGLVL